MNTIESTALVHASAVSSTGEVAQSRVNQATANKRTDAASKPDRTDQTDQTISLQEFGVLDARKEAAGKVAAEIRGIGEARDRIADARSQLELIVKSFPPFPPGSAEREQFLNSVAGIRSIIERLTIPREPRNQLTEALGEQALINSDASDEALKAGLDGLTRAESVLAAVQADFSDPVLKPTGKFADEADIVDQSKQTGVELSRQGRAISRSPEAVLPLLE